MQTFDVGEIERLLDVQTCIEAVEAAFRARGSGARALSSVAGLPLEGGKLHAKLATLERGRRYAVAKINANLPGNPERRGLPSIQGVLLLFDATTGTPLAALESGIITAMRTAAASAVAAKWLALPNASSVAVIGCGFQARAHIAALRCVRPIKEVRAFDVDQKAAEAFCEEMTKYHAIACRIAPSGRAAARSSQIVVTLTPSHEAILDRDDVDPGTFIAAVGADNEDKQEIGTSVMASAVVVVDDLDQCARMGDLHHAVAAGAMMITDVRASLDQIVAEQIRGRLSADEIIVFDSTGVAIEDAAAAAVVFERASQTEVLPPPAHRPPPPAHRPIQ